MTGILNAYIVRERKTDDRLRFQFMPDQIADSKQVNWFEQPILGRSEPYQNYEHSGVRTISLELTFFASVDQNDEGTPDDVLRKVHWLRALAYPEQEQNIITGPEVVWLIIGRDFIAMRCVASGYEVSYKRPWGGTHTPLTVDRPHHATVNLTFREVNTHPYTGDVVRSGRESTTPFPLQVADVPLLQRMAGTSLTF